MRAKRSGDWEGGTVWAIGAFLRYNIGRRGAFLLFLAFVDIVFSWSLFAPTHEARRSTGLAYIADFAPLWMWAILWGVTGAICLVQAFMRHDKVAFTAAVMCKTLWGLMYMLGWLFLGIERGYVSTAIWLAFAAIAYMIAGWPEGSPLSAPTAQE